MPRTAWLQPPRVGVASMAFAVVRDSLGITDAHLFKQVEILADAGYVATTKQGVASRADARKTTWSPSPRRDERPSTRTSPHSGHYWRAPSKTRTSAAPGARTLGLPRWVRVG